MKGFKKMIEKRSNLKSINNYLHNKEYIARMHERNSGIETYRIYKKESDEFLGYVTFDRHYHDVSHIVIKEVIVEE